ncbi:hypothetical protein D3C72_2365420 [compost metagenome]
MYAANLGGGQHYIVDRVVLEKRLDRRLRSQIQLGMRPRLDVLIALSLEFSHYGGADHAAMPGHEEAAAKG